MPLSLIPNQPFIFEQVLPDQPCLNNDDSAYSPLVAPNDVICVQQIMTPCVEDVMCDPDMIDVGDVPNDGWNCTDGWSSSSPSDVAFDGANTGADLCESLISPTATAGQVCYIDFTITSITGVCGINVQLGSYATSDEYDALGTYRVYLIAQTNADLWQFIVVNPSPTAGDTIEITINSMGTAVADCWLDDFNYIPGPSWEYNYNDEDSTDIYGYFCSLGFAEGVAGDLINNSAYTTDGNYHRVSFTISDCTAGGVEVILGGEYLGTIDTNGTYQMYGVPTDASNTLIFHPVDSFQGCISHVSVDDFGLLDNTDLTNSVYSLVITNSSGVAATDEIPFEINDDRITWCFNIDDITNGGNPVELSCDAGNRLKITAACEEAEPVEYLSINNLRYNNEGWDCTFIVNGWSDGYAFGFYFGSVTAPVFNLVQRLRVLQFAPRYPAVGEEYLYSNGSYSRSYAQSGKVRQCWFDYVDELTHDVIRLQILCDVLTLDSDVYFAPIKDYEPEWDDHKRNLAQSRIDLVKEEVLFNSSCNVMGQAPCTTNTVTVPPSTMIGYKMVGSFDLVNVDPANFAMNVCINGFFATASANDATTLSGRNALLTYLGTYITISLGGSIISQSASYAGTVLSIDIRATGDYNSTYSAASFEVDGLARNGNVIMLQPE